MGYRLRSSAAVVTSGRLASRRALDSHAVTRARGGVWTAVAVSETLTRRAEALAESVLLEPRPRKRMLVIVNPYATTVSERLKNLVVYALRGRYDVQAVETEARAHATELCREAARERYDVVVASGHQAARSGSAVFSTAKLYRAGRRERYKRAGLVTSLGTKPPLCFTRTLR